MDYLNLFSHPPETEAVSSGKPATSGVEQPIFSDGPEAKADSEATSSP